MHINGKLGTGQETVEQLQLTAGKLGNYAGKLMIMLVPAGNMYVLDPSPAILMVNL